MLYKCRLYLFRLSSIFEMTTVSRFLIIKVSTSTKKIIHLFPWCSYPGYLILNHHTSRFHAKGIGYKEDMQRVKIGNEYVHSRKNKWLFFIHFFCLVVYFVEFIGCVCVYVLHMCMFVCVCMCLFSFIIKCLNLIWEFPWRFIWKKEKKKRIT